MPCLNDFEIVSKNLRICKKLSADLYMFVFEENGDRNNRKKLREFKGFDYYIESEQFMKKKIYVEKALNNADLI